MAFQAFCKKIVAKLSEYDIINNSKILKKYMSRKKEKVDSMGEKKNYSIAEVAAMVGYQSQRHFSKLFREFTGQYPSDIRKN